MPSKNKFQYVFWFDTETTGLDPKVNDIHQLYCSVELCEPGQGRGKVLLEREYLMQPTNPAGIVQAALDVSHKTVEQVMSNPPAEQALNDMIRDVLATGAARGATKCVLGGHNVMFDKGFLEELFKKVKTRVSFPQMFYHNPRLCSAELAASLYFIDRMGANELPEVENFKLITCAQMMGIPFDKSGEGFHDAGYDLRTTRELYYRLAEFAMRQQGTTKFSTAITSRMEKAEAQVHKLHEYEALVLNLKAGYYSPEQFASEVLKLYSIHQGE